MDVVICALGVIVLGMLGMIAKLSVDQNYIERKIVSLVHRMLDEEENFREKLNLIQDHLGVEIVENKKKYSKYILRKPAEDDQLAKGA